MTPGAERRDGQRLAMNQRDSGLVKIYQSWTVWKAGWFLGAAGAPKGTFLKKRIKQPCRDHVYKDLLHAVAWPANREKGVAVSSHSGLFMD